MQKPKASMLTKRGLIEKANNTIVVVTAVAAFVSIFSLVASRSLLNQEGYQSKIISAKSQAKKQLDDDIAAETTLNSAYSTFVSTPQNILGGDPNGTKPNDGNNAKIVLDALPPQYDFPALATSLEKLITSQGLTITSITGIDEELVQQGTSSTVNPVPVAMPFQVQVNGNYASLRKLLDQFQASIRPFQILTLSATVPNNQNDMSFLISAQTYYQPGKSFTIGEKVIR